MKTIVLLIALFLALPQAQAQKLVIGSKIPELKSVQWLSKAPTASQQTFIEFYQSSNSTSKQYFPKLEDVYAYKTNLNVVVLTRENNDAIAQLVKDFGSKYCIGYDQDGKAFEALGVKFVPFSMMVDSKNNLLWQGNLSQFSPEVMKANIK